MSYSDAGANADVSDAEFGDAVHQKGRKRKHDDEEQECASEPGSDVSMIARGVNNGSLHEAHGTVNDDIRDVAVIAAPTKRARITAPTGSHASVKNIKPRRKRSLSKSKKRVRRARTPVVVESDASASADGDGGDTSKSSKSGGDTDSTSGSFVAPRPAQEKVGDVLRLGYDVYHHESSPMTRFLLPRVQADPRKAPGRPKASAAVAGCFVPPPAPCNLTNMLGGGNVLKYHDNGRFFVGGEDVKLFRAAWTETLLGGRSARAPNLRIPYDTRALCLSQNLMAMAPIVGGGGGAGGAEDGVASGTTQDSLAHASTTVIFPFVLDLDDVGEIDFSDTRFHYLLTMIVCAVRSCFPEHEHDHDWKTCVTQTVDVDMQHKSGRDGNRPVRGVHIHFPWVHVNSVVAIQLSAFVAYTLYREQSDTNAHRLAKSIDWGIFKGGRGVCLRMVGFPKPPRCPFHGRDGEELVAPSAKIGGANMAPSRTCAACLAVGTGRAPQGRHWAVACTGNSGGLAQDSLATCRDVAQVVKFCNMLLSPRNVARGLSPPSFRIPPATIDYVDGILSSKGVGPRLLCRGGGASGGLPMSLGGGVGGGGKRTPPTCVRLYVGEDVTLELQQAINRMRPAWQNVRLKSEWEAKAIFVVPRTDTDSLALTLSTAEHRYQEWRIELAVPSGHCDRKQYPEAAHQNATIYFVVNRARGLTCHCWAESCKGLKFAERTLSEALHNRLFIELPALICRQSVRANEQREASMLNSLLQPIMMAPSTAPRLS
jgi:hypothetical protein